MPTTTATPVTATFATVKVTTDGSGNVQDCMVTAGLAATTTPPLTGSGSFDMTTSLTPQQLTDLQAIVTLAIQNILEGKGQ